MLKICMWLVLLVAAVWATTAFDKDVKCPVCTTTFKVAVMMSSNNAGGMDRDFCEHAGGTDPVILAIAACPKCHYANYVDSLTDKNPPKVPAALKAAILAGKLRMPAYAPGRDDPHAQGEIPAWVAYDLRAQLCQMKAKPDHEELLMLYLRATWSLRSEDNPFSAGFRDTDDKVLEELFKGQAKPVDDENRADRQLKMARDLLPKLASLPETQRRAAANWIGYVLREHGENIDLLAALPSLLKHLPVELEARVKTTVEREQGYQRLALRELQQTAGSQSNLIYLKGELHRRLGEYPQARAAYDEAAKHQPKEWLAKWIKEQSALLP